MKKHLLIALIALGLGLGLTLMVSTPSMAVHKGSGDLQCGNCHTMHSSQGGTSGASMGGGSGSFILLRNPLVTDRATIHNLCLQCHAQTGAQASDVMNTGDIDPNNNTTPPKVYLSSLGWTEGSNFTQIGAGGDFANAGTYNSSTGWSLNGASGDGSGTVALGKGHSIGLTNVAPPGNNTGGGTAVGSTIATFSCTSCHDPHGTSSTTLYINKFRNLKANAMVSGAQETWTNMGAGSVDIASSYVGGVNSGNNTGGQLATGGSCATVAAENCIWPVMNTAGSQNAYKTSGTAPTFAGSGIALNATPWVQMSAFCAQCHGAWHEGTTTTNMSVSDWARHPVDNAIDDGTESSGAGVNITDFAWYNGLTGTAVKVPAAQDVGTDTFYYANNSADKVFCLSCHFAHGSPYYDILRWNYTTTVTSGGQTGNGVPTGKGCQQCHNR